MEVPSLFSLVSDTVERKISKEQLSGYKFWKDTPSFESRFLKLPSDIRENVKLSYRRLRSLKKLRPFNDLSQIQIFSDICEINFKRNLKHVAKNGFYLLGIASMYGYANLVMELLDAGVDIRQGAIIPRQDPIERIICEPTYYTPLRLACRGNNYSTAEVLIRRGAIPIDDYSKYYNRSLLYPVTKLPFEIISA